MEQGIGRIYFLDAESKDGDRMTSFGGMVQDVISDFMDWIRDLDIRADDLNYSFLYAADGSPEPLNLARLEIREDGSAEIIPSDSTGSSKKCKEIQGRIRGILRRAVKR